MFTKQKKQQGFTLIEILIALTIFAVIAVICTIGLKRLINIHDRMKTVQAQLNDTALALVLLQRDLQNLGDRPVRDAQAHLMQPIILSGNSLEFTDIAHLLRVRYDLSLNGLTRSIWPVLDQPALPTEPSKQLLWPGVSKLSFQLIDAEGTAQTSWPPPGSAATSLHGFPMPKAVIITLTSSTEGELKKIVALSGDTFYDH